MKGTEVTMNLDVAVWFTWRLKACSLECGRSTHPAEPFVWGAQWGIAKHRSRDGLTIIRAAAMRADEKCDITDRKSLIASYAMRDTRERNERM